MRSWIDNLNFRRLIGGGLLIGLAGVIGVAGLALAGSAIIGATRVRISQIDSPRSQAARRQTRRLGHAARVGAGAWRADGS